MSNPRAFTLVELLMTLAIVAIVSLTVVPFFFSSTKKANDETAVQKAGLLDLSKIRFLDEQGSSARNAWDLATTDQEKYDLLRPFISAAPLVFDTSGATKGFTPVGYRFTLNGILDPTTVTRLSDGVILYGELPPTPTTTPTASPTP